jgi:hypothetical protein
MFLAIRVYKTAFERNRADVRNPPVDFAEEFASAAAQVELR